MACQNRSGLLLMTVTFLPIYYRSRGGEVAGKYGSSATRDCKKHLKIAHDRAVVGGEGKDFVDGARGTDRMLGEGGGDFLVDGPVGEGSINDVLSGGEGDDILLGDHVPAVRDIVSCGGGLDRVVADSKDVVADDCERVRVVHGSKAEVLDQEDEFFNSLPPAQREFWNTFDEQLAPFPSG